jgi:hypothetical protein
VGPVYYAEDAQPLEVRTYFGALDDAVLYEHVYPHERQFWVRAKMDFYGMRDGEPRFRELKR